jgi:hypothetical protein
MKTIQRQKWLFGLGLVVALLALGAGASTVFGGVTAQSTQSAGQPQLPAGERQAAPPAAGYAQTGPRLSETQIAEVAQQEAARAGDATPGGGSDEAMMTAVDSSLADAVDAGPHTEMQASSPGMEALLKSEVAVVVMHGNFTLDSAPVPPGAPVPTGTVLTLTIDSHSGWVDQRELTMSEAPGLAALGTPKSLSVAAG